MTTPDSDNKEEKPPVEEQAQAPQGKGIQPENDPNKHLKSTTPRSRQEVGSDTLKSLFPKRSYHKR